MKKTTDLSKAQFNKLHELIIAKYKQTENLSDEDFKRQTIAKQYGYDIDIESDCLSNTPNLRKCILRDSKVQEYLNQQKLIDQSTDSCKYKAFKGRYLRDRWNEVNKNNKPRVKFTAKPYDKIFFVFLGCEDIDAFKKIHCSNLAKSEETATTPPLPKSKNDVRLTSNTIEYRGYYYHFRENKVRELEFKIDFSIAERKNVIAKEVIENIREDREDEYTGTAKLVPEKEYICIDLDSNENYKFQLLGYFKDNFKNEYNIIPLTFNGVGDDGDFVSGEIILLKKNGKTPTEKSIKHIKRYLYLKSKQIRLPHKPTGNPQELVFRKDPDNMLRVYIGSYRVWNLNPKGKVFQSFMRITEFLDVDMEVWVNNNKSKRKGKLELHKLKMFVKYYTINSRRILGTAILTPTSPSDVLKGVYATIGNDIEPPVAGKLALLREDDNSEVEAKILSKEELNLLFEKNNKYKKLYDAIKDIPVISGG